MARRDFIALLKAAAFTLALLPLIWLTWLALGPGLGANPIEAIVRSTGDWALRFLVITLAITPLRKLTGWGAIIRFRRMIGLFAFFYATVHLTSYVVLDQFLDWTAIWADVLKRPYITVGVVTYLLLIPLTFTSTRGMQRRLGGRRWQRLHRLIYPTAGLAVLHFFLMVKADIREPIVYALLIVFLLFARLPRIRRKSVPHAHHG